MSGIIVYTITRERDPARKPERKRLSRVYNMNLSCCCTTESMRWPNAQQTSLVIGWAGSHGQRNSDLLQRLLLHDLQPKTGYLPIHLISASEQLLPRVVNTISTIERGVAKTESMFLPLEGTRWNHASSLQRGGSTLHPGWDFKAQPMGQVSEALWFISLWGYSGKSSLSD